MIGHGAALQLYVRLGSNLDLRLGVTDDLVYVPAARYRGNLVAAAVALFIRDVGRLARNPLILIRAGGFTHHALRREYAPTSGANLAAVLDITYDLAAPRRGSRGGIR